MRSKLDTISEAAARGIARRTARRGFMAGVSALLFGVSMIPLLPVAHAGTRKKDSPSQAGIPPNGIEPDVDPGDPTSCDYWRYCAFNSYLCSCCGGTHNSCPPGTTPARVSWIGTCRNPADDRDYLISYTDCCGQSGCGQCPCSRHEGAKPIYTSPKSNEINWCTGTDGSFLPSCSTAVIIGVMPAEQT